MTENKDLQTNEIAVAEKAELVNGTKISENDEFVVVIENGKHKRKAKYQDYNSIVPKNREEKVWLANLIDNDEDTGNGLKDNVKKEIVVADIITRKYDKVDEDTGELVYGVLTYLITPEREAFVTSSKSVYFSIHQYMKMLGYPHEEGYENIIVKVGKKKMQNGDSITIKLIG